MTVRPSRAGDPERIGGYTVVGRLGEGGQGEVFLVRGDSGELAAAKLLRADLADDEDSRDRFLREVGAAKRVARFCTAQVIDVGVAGDRPYIVSEYVDGPTLHQAVTENGPRRGAGLERLAIGTATALAAIHEAGVVHRDFKPHNVLLGADGPRVIDFGIARALDAATTGRSGIVGTPSYVAPEQVSGDPVGPPADVFAWGSTMVFAANGRPPFARDSVPAALHAVLHGEPDLGDLSGPLRELVANCLTKDPAARPTAQQVLLALLAGADVTVPLPAPGEELLAEGTTLAAGPPTTMRLTGQTEIAATPRPARNRSRLLIGAGGLIALAIIGLVAFLLLRPAGDQDGGEAGSTEGPSAAIPEAFGGVWVGEFVLPWEGTQVTWDAYFKPGSTYALVESGESGCANGTLSVTGVDERTMTMRFDVESSACSSSDVVATLQSDDTVRIQVTPDAPYQRPYEGVLRKQ